MAKAGDSDQTPKSLCPLLNDSNYATWSVKMECVLIRQGLIELIQNAPPVLPGQRWLNRNAQARATIVLHLDPSQLVHIRNLDNAYDVWTHLRDEHLRLRAGSTTLFFQRLINLRLKEGGDLRAHLHQMRQLRQELADRNVNLDDDIYCFTVLNSLPKSYNAIAAQLGAQDPQQMTAAGIYASLLNEEDRTRAQAEANGERYSPSPGASAETAQALKTVVRCQLCNIPGHTAKTCRRPQKDSGSQQQASGPKGRGSGGSSSGGGSSKGPTARKMLVMLTQLDDQDDDGSYLIIDSGSSHHLVNDKRLFQTFEKLDSIVSQADGNSLKSIGKGTIFLKSLNLSISNVYLVPELKQNLFSVSQIDEKGFELCFHRGTCVISKDGEVLLTGHRDKDNLFRLSYDKSDACFNVVDDCLTGPEEPKEAKKQPSKKGLTRCFQIVSAGVFGPMPKSLGKAKYYLLITDHFSKYTWFYPLQKPQQAIVKFSEFHAKVELKHGCKIECLLTNDIPLFTSQEFQAFFDDKGIHHKFAKTQAAWDKSLCVKVNTELEAGMQAQLLSSGLSEQLWAESISFFLYQWLRQVPKGQRRSPYEILFQQKPDVSNTKVFGIKMWVASLEGKPVQGILLGFEEGQYRVMLSSSNEVILTQEVEHSPTPQETYVLDEFPIGANDFDASYTDTSGSDNDSFAEGSTPSSSDTGETVIHKGTHAVFNRPSSDDEKVLEALDPLFTIGMSSPKSPEGENLSKQDLHLSRRSERIRRGPKRYSQEFANTAIANLAVLRTPKQAAVTQAKPQQQVVKRNTVSVNRATALVPWKPKLVNPVSESSTAGKSYFVYDNCLFTSLNDALTFASFSISGFRGDVSINPIHGTDAACG
ncbi:protein FAM168A isoform X1 [Zootoca vivipara]|uniref:protein FAM168A isoform X1 n=1 Tax=Zootoca vivipara TaxID=8524 RepID=UPI00293C0796|nr:protein FAM168A isoform X1 [Zootoca vivipara]